MLAVLAGLITPAAAQGAVTVGSTLAATSGAGSGDQTYSPSMLSGGGLTTSPISGVIHVWRLKGGASPGAIRFRVLRPQGGTFLGAGTGPTETITGAFSEVRPFTIAPQGLAIQAGDRIGVDDGVLGDPVSGMQAIIAGTSFDTWFPFLPDGTSLAPNGNGPREFLLNADVEPDVDHDRFGDETRDACNSQTATAGACSSAFTATATALKGGQVQLAVTIPGAGTVKAGDASAAFAMVAKRKKKKKRKALLNQASASRSETTAGTVQLTLTPTGAARKRLKKKGKARAAVKAIFTTPNGGTSSSQTLNVSLKK